MHDGRDRHQTLRRACRALRGHPDRLLTFTSPFLKHAPTIVTREYADGHRTAQERSVASYEEAFRLELEHFHDCIVRGSAPDTPASDAAADTELMVAIIRAAATGRPQSVSG